MITEHSYQIQLIMANSTYAVLQTSFY